MKEYIFEIKGPEIMKVNEEWILTEIVRLARESNGNRMRELDGSIIFEEPMVGFCPGDDPFFDELKGIIGEFHLTPYELMERCCVAEGIPVPDRSEVGVISYVLPIAGPTRYENAMMSDFPSERWSHTRLFGEMFNRSLQANIVSALRDEGMVAFAPELEEHFTIIQDEKVGWASTWSQRHVAFACGLGTFGISDGLITAKGKAHRLGSVVVNMPFSPPERPDDIHAGCIYFQTGECMACAKRCPVGAITENGHDKSRCSEFVFGGTTEGIRERYGIDIYACGLCQTGVPCEHCDPVKRGSVDE